MQSTSTLQKTARIILCIFMLGAGLGHLTFARVAFQAQVPNWVPMEKDLVVVLSGIAEIAIAIALLFAKKHRVQIGIFLAIFYVLVFPGNIAQYLNHYSAFGLDTDQKRLLRLFFQPVLIVWVLWATGALPALRKR